MHLVPCISDLSGWIHKTNARKHCNSPKVGPGLASVPNDNLSVVVSRSTPCCSPRAGTIGVASTYECISLACCYDALAVVVLL
jgi:hypothetical protein